MRCPIYFVFLFIANIVFSQNIIVLTDKEYLELQGKTKALISSNIDSAFMYADQIERSNNYTHKTFAAATKSYLFQLKGNQLKSKQLYDQAFQYLSKVHDSKSKTNLNAYLLNCGGLSEWKRGNLSHALNLYSQGKKLSEKTADIIQIIKFNNNISSIYADIGNYKLAIAIAKESNKLTDANVYLYDKEKYNQSKSVVSYKLGVFYEKEFYASTKNYSLLDSAEFYYKQTIIYSNSLAENNINAKVNLGKIYSLKNNFKNAEKIYLGLLKSNKEDLTIDNFKCLNINLGELYYVQKKYNEALMCFNRVDSLNSVDGKSNNDVVFNHSNYYQAKIYNIFNDNKKALLHSKLYLDNYKKAESKLSDEAININFKIGKEALTKEMLEIEHTNKNKVLATQMKQGSLIVLVLLLLIFLIWNINQKKKTNLKAMRLIEEFKLEIEKNKRNDHFDSSLPTKNESLSLSIDEEKENEIVEKLKDLETKLIFLNQDFTQQYVAKKIKTNTSYLSYVVNKRFGKSFSEYANELKINYVINQLITNPTYRKYSTQAIAESAGFKKANSFTASFKKRTGVTPVQFAEKIELK